MTTADPSDGALEVRRYLLKLVLLIVGAALLMSIVAVIAWFRYGRHLEQTERPAPVRPAPSPIVPRPAR